MLRPYLVEQYHNEKLVDKFILKCRNNGSVEIAIKNSYNTGKGFRYKVLGL